MNTLWDYGPYRKWLFFCSLQVKKEKKITLFQMKEKMKQDRPLHAMCSNLRNKIKVSWEKENEEKDDIVLCLSSEGIKE